MNINERGFSNMLKEQMQEIGESAKSASYLLSGVSAEVKNQALWAMARALRERTEMILEANSQDMDAGRAKGLSDALLDRLLLTPDRINNMAEGLQALVGLPDPVGEVTKMTVRPNGLRVGKMRVPLGVIGIIYEIGRASCRERV